MFSKSKLVGLFIVSLCLLFSFTFSQTRETGALAGKVTPQMVNLYQVLKSPFPRHP